MNTFLHYLACAVLTALPAPPAPAAPGDVDMSFDPNAGNQVSAIAVQADGKIVIGGGFQTIGGVTHPYIARLNAIGTLDTGFNTVVNSGVLGITVQAGGTLFLDGIFNSVNGVNTNNYAWLNADGTLDSGFYPPPSHGDPRPIALQADGKIIVGGSIDRITDTAGHIVPLNGIARLNADFTLDAHLNPDGLTVTGFNPNVFGSVDNALIQPDGKIIISGSFTSVGGVSRIKMARLNADGTLDASFVGPPLEPSHIGPIQADGKIIITIDFAYPQGTGPSYIARLNTDGSIDAGFNCYPNQHVYATVLQPDGKIVIGGSFTSANGVTRNKVARLNPDGTPDSSFNPDVAGNVVSIAMQPDGKIIVGGQFSTVSGVTRHNIVRLVGNSLTPIQQWKLTQLGSINSPDLGDTDGDGLVHLAEYALNLSPTAPSLPPAVTRFVYAEGERLRMFFTRDPARNDVTIEVQAADSPAGPWTTVAASTLGGVTTGPGYVGGDDASPGLKTLEVRDTVDISPTTASRYLRVKVMH